MVLPLRRYLDFGGRARRKEYWFFVALVLFVIVAASIVDLLLGFGQAGRFDNPHAAGWSASSNGPVAALALLVLAIPSLSVAVRRLHDTDRSGWWLLLLLLPIFGSFVLLMFYCLDGTRGANRFGADPKSEHLGDVFA